VTFPNHLWDVKWMNGDICNSCGERQCDANVTTTLNMKHYSLLIIESRYKRTLFGLTNHELNSCFFNESRLDGSPKTLYSPLNIHIT
jgi:hypothetical protein